MNKTGQNTTLHNISKRTRLQQEHVYPKHIINHPETKNFLRQIKTLTHSKETILYNIGKTLNQGNTNPNYLAFTQEYNYPTVDLPFIPEESDILGAAYQYLNTKYENLAQGSFYTSEVLAKEITQTLDFSENQTIIDLSCGSGIFLFTSNAKPENMFGVDSDPTAVMIAKFNYYLKHPATPVIPQIYEADFLDWYIENQNTTYDYVVGNPPYGANLNLQKIHSDHITTGESFSYFIEYGYTLTKPTGKLLYLLPESLLNVKRHMDIRDFILNHTNLDHIKLYDHKFAGVMSDIYLIQLSHTTTPTLTFTHKGTTHTIPKQVYKELKNHVFIPSPKEDMTIINKIKQKTTTSLRQSKFALGVVTGDNSKKLHKEQIPQSEKIYTGKEVEKYHLTTPKNYLIYDRTNLQQVAPDEIYRAPIKLVYKVITKQFKVAIDETGSLTSSSANIIIPNVPGNTAYTIALLLNSPLYSYLNQKLHGATNKVSKGNLEALPLPEFTTTQQQEIKTLIQQHLNNEIEETILQEYVNNYFQLTQEDINYITTTLE